MAQTNTTSAETLVSEDQPGRLGGSSVEFEIHTIEANGLVTGRKAPDKPKIISLDEFNKRAGIAYTAFAQGDPFAGDVLVRLEKNIGGAQETLKQLETEIESMMQGKARISLGVSRHPINYQINLARYGTQLADLILDYDQVVMTIRNANFHNRIKTNQARIMIERGRKTLRSTLTSLINWRYTGVNTIDLQQQNQLAQDAIMKLVQSRFLDLSEYEGDWGKVASHYARMPLFPSYGAGAVSSQINPLAI